MGSYGRCGVCSPASQLFYCLYGRPPCAISLWMDWDLMNPRSRRVLHALINRDKNTESREQLTVRLSSENGPLYFLAL